MEFLSILTNPANNFDGGMPLTSKDYRALRDGIVTLLARSEAIVNRLDKLEAKKVGRPVKA